MEFKENLQFVRKQKNMTQEELALALDVSRQTVSKWESGASYPEMDKLLAICELFDCSMDAIMRGNLESLATNDSEAYEKEHNGFTRAIAGGTALVLAGVATMLFLLGFGINETIGTMVFLSLITVAAVIFIVSGIQHGEFVKKHPVIEPFYEKDIVDAFRKKFAYLIAIPTAIILIGVICLIGSTTLSTPGGISTERWEYICTGVFMLLVAISAPMFIYAGMQSAKYNVEEYNNERKREKTNSLSDRVCGCIMLLATAAFLLMGFIWDLWNIAWVTFPVGGILCAAVSTLLNKENK